MRKVNFDYKVTKTDTTVSISAEGLKNVILLPSCNGCDAINGVATFNLPVEMNARLVRNDKTYRYIDMTSELNSIVEDPIVEDPIVEDPIVEDPIVEDPIVEDPITEDPITEDPITEDPITEDPIVEDPVTEDPITEDPV